MSPGNLLPVGLQASYARRDGDRVVLVLHLPGLPHVVDGMLVRFQRGEQRFSRRGTVRATVGGAIVEVAVPARRVAGDVWRLAVQPEYDAAFVRVEARLLAAPGHPVALLPGPAPATRMAAPDPVRRSQRPLARILGRARRAVGAVRRRVGRRSGPHPR